jgi:PGF-CTERM protein/uncharacterized repeat protein (TIGR01451 family)
MNGRIVKMFAFGLVLVLLLSGMLAFVPAMAQAKSDYGLVAEWHFDEGSGSVVKDSSGYGNDGVIRGAKWTEGKFGSALSFDGYDDYVEVLDSDSLDIIGDLTLVAWVKTSKDGEQIIAFGDSVHGLTGYLWMIGQSTAGRQSFHSSGNRQWGKSDSTVNDGTWHHVAVVLSDTTATFYKDGNPDGSMTSAAPVSHTGVRYIGTGSNLAADFNGIIDEVRIYNRALTADEIKTHYEGKQPELTLTKSASPFTIQEGETTTISIRVENTGTGDAKSIEVTDTIPTGFKIISGSKSASFDEIKPGDYRTSEYTLKATGSGKFTCEPAPATYKDAGGNSYSAASNSVSIQVGGEVPVGADSDGDGWSDEKEREMGTNPYSVDSDGDGLKDPEDPNPTVPEEKKTPGFEAVFTVVGLLAVVYVLRRRR